MGVGRSARVGLEEVRRLFAENAVSDFAQDTGADDSFDTYNDMLAQLAERDREATRKKYL